jgi:pyruvate,orthophosphate dikinase
MSTAAEFSLSDALVPFGGSAPSVDQPNRDILGGKGLGLQEMTRIGVENDLPKEIWDQVKEAIKRVEADMGKKFGAEENPLLFSCRSGAAISMPGMMDTVLNIVSLLLLLLIACLNMNKIC